jgi:hypothetical protein
MMDGLAFLPVPDLTNGIHLLRTLCPDDPPEAAELLDYFDSTYISDQAAVSVAMMLVSGGRNSPGG